VTDGTKQQAPPTILCVTNLLIWINMRVYLLQQMMVGSTIDEFRADELGEEL